MSDGCTEAARQRAREEEKDGISSQFQHAVLVSGLLPCDFADILILAQKGANSQSFIKWHNMRNHDVLDKFTIFVEAIPDYGSE